MKGKIILLLLLTLTTSGLLPAQDSTYRVSFTIRSISDRKQNKTNVGALPVPTAAIEIRNMHFVIDNRSSTDLHFRVLGIDVKRRSPVVIKSKSTTAFEMKNSGFILGAGDTVQLGSMLIYSIQTQEGDTIFGRPVPLSVRNDNLRKVLMPGTSAPMTYRPGIIYYDAVMLNNPATDRMVKIGILKYYGYDILKAELGPELRAFGDNIIAEGPGQQNLIDVGMKGIGPLLNTVGNYDVTNIADGISRFLVMRVKQELSIAFFQHFKEELDKPPTSDLKYLFPTTYDILYSIDNEIYNWDNYITSLRDAFDKDLSNLVCNLQIFEARADLLKDFRNNTVGHSSARVALYIAKGFVDHVTAGQLLDDFNADEYLTPTAADKDNKNVQWFTFNLRSAVKSLQLLSASVRSHDPDEYWISDSDFRDLMTSDDFFGYYNLLLWLKARNEKICFRTDVNDPSKVIYLYNMINGLPAGKQVFNGFVVKIKDFRSSYSRMKAAVAGARTDSAKAKISYLDIYPFIQSSVNILKYSNEAMYRLMPDSLKPKIEEVYKKSDEIMDILNKGGELGMDLSLKRYSAAIADLAYLFNKAKDVVKKDDQGNDQPVMDAANRKAFTEEMIKYGTFMASITNAKSSEEVAQVIQNHALPPGSSRIKRESAFNVSINAYPGFYFGYEQIEDVDPKGIKNWKINSYGITAPLGIAVSIGQRKLFRANWSYSLFITAIDIGAVTSFRLKNDSVTSVPTIQLKDIISPGLFFSIGIPKCPLSVNMGVQIGPNLRAVSEPSKDATQVQNTYSDKMYWRYSISLCVDIPVLNLANRLDRKRK